MSKSTNTFLASASLMVLTLFAPDANAQIFGHWKQRLKDYKIKQMEMGTMRRTSFEPGKPVRIIESITSALPSAAILSFGDIGSNAKDITAKAGTPEAEAPKVKPFKLGEY